MQNMPSRSWSAENTDDAFLSADTFDEESEPALEWQAELQRFNERPSVPRLSNSTRVDKYETGLAL